MSNKRKKVTSPQWTLSIIVSIVMVARFLRGDYYSVFLCILTLVLFNVPHIASKIFNVFIPRELEVVILLFIFSDEILGEIGNFYNRIPWWDSMLHTINGFLMAAIGFAMINILNNTPKFHFNLSPVFVTVVAFCFSMTIGIAWEFFEYSMDVFAETDMQKDDIIKIVSSVELNPQGENDPVILEDIEKTVIFYNNGQNQYVIENGYLDVGLRDTMKDLIVNYIGAIVFSVIGYFYLVGRNKGIFASKFIPQYIKSSKHSTTKDK